MTSTADLAKSSSTATPEMVALRVENGIAFVTIDVPDSKVNTLGDQSMRQLNGVIDKLATDKSIRAVIIRSGKSDNFIAGADVKEIQQLQNSAEIHAYEASRTGKMVFDKIDQLPCRVVAAINGQCLGGGTELALACDYRVASSKASIGLPEIKLGFIPGWGGCIRLPKLIGVTEALGVIMTAPILKAAKAWKKGMVDEVVEPDQLDKRALEIAQGALPRRSGKTFQETAMKLLLETNPLGLSVIRDQAYKAMMRETRGKYPAPKEALNVVMKGLTVPAEKAYELESQSFARLAVSNVSKNLVGIWFATTESKKLPANIKDKPQISTVGVLGAGVMGAGIAQAAAKAGYKVIVKDVEQRFVDKGKQTISDLFAKLVDRKSMKKEEADKIVSSMVFSTEYSALSDCDLVIEAVIEDLKTKQHALKELENVIKKPYVFATNTSSLSVSMIAEGTSDPTKVVGLHFFNPVHKMPLAEVVRGQKTSDAAVAAAMTVASKLDKTTVITSDAPGFVVNRILAPYMREAAVLASEGVPIEDVDKAMKSFGMPMGPFVLLDEVGLDVAGKVVHVMHEALGERMTPPPLMQEIEHLKLLGKKGGKGIYLYDEKKKPAGVNPQLAALIKAPVNKKLPSEIQDRLVLLMLNEAARCLQEHVVEDPAQLDLAMIFGTGFAPFTGGILKYADSEGIDVVYMKLDYLSRVIGPRYQPCELLVQMHNNRHTFYRERMPVAK